MSDKVYRIAVVALLALILLVTGINTFSQIRSQRQNAELIQERNDAIEAQAERVLQEGFEQNRDRQQQPQNLIPQDGRGEQIQAQNQELRDNLHKLEIQNEEQGNQIRELFGQIEELRHQLLELSERVEHLPTLDEEG